MKQLAYSIFSFALFFALQLGVHPIAAQSDNETFVYGDALPDAPELAARGDYAVGVRTIKIVNEDQVDILNSKAGNEVKYDRPLMLEVWYPAAADTDKTALT
ncbi:MAG: dienelactone hydrolase, partial [Bacteroidota bacterium]